MTYLQNRKRVTENKYHFQGIKEGLDFRGGDLIGRLGLT